jgi:GNAT superfamily N-acetyltransferase
MSRVRSADDQDRPFVVEMARLACSLDDRPLPDATAPVVIACLPLSPSAAVVAGDQADQPLGAAWWHLHQPSMLQTPDGSPIPELTMAVAHGSRGQGIGAALIEALVTEAASQFSVLALGRAGGGSALR